MSMLDRYKKPGGFQTLLALVETCTPAKQEKFLELIRAEDTAWADAIKSKMLDIQKIYNWNDATLAEIAGTLQDLTLATALHATSESIKQRLLVSLNSGRQRKIEELFERGTPAAGEIVATHMKIIETVRKMTLDGSLRLDKIDPALQIEDHLEENLLRSGSTASAIVTPPAHSGSAVHPDFTIQYETPMEELTSPEAARADGANLTLLKRRFVDLQKENATLKQELAAAKSKLDQIRRIA